MQILVFRPERFPEQRSIISPDQNDVSVALRVGVFSHQTGYFRRVLHSLALLQSFGLLFGAPRSCRSVPRQFDHKTSSLPFI
jgi:hypothetical protein